MISLQCIELLISIFTLIAILSISNFFYVKSSRTFNPIQLEVSSIGVPILKVTQKDKAYCFIVDTGATHSSINISTLENFKVRKLPFKGSMYGMEGNLVETAIAKASFNINSNSYKETFQVLDLSQSFNLSEETYGIAISGILGNSFLKKNNLAIDVTNNILYRI